MKNVRKIAYWSLFAAAIIVPIWFALGRALFGVGGWGVLLTIFTGVVIVFPYHLVLMSLALAGKRMMLSVRTTIVLAAYYVAQVIVQISFIDGGDTEESTNSVLTKAGATQNLSDTLYMISLVITLILMVALIILLAVDARRNKKNALA